MEKCTVAEKSLLCIFANWSRRRVVINLQSIGSHFDEKDVQELVKLVIGKLERMTDKEFEELMLGETAVTGTIFAIFDLIWYNIFSPIRTGIVYVGPFQKRKESWYEYIEVLTLLLAVFCRFNIHRK